MSPGQGRPSGGAGQGAPSSVRDTPATDGAGGAGSSGDGSGGHSPMNGPGGAFGFADAAARIRREPIGNVFIGVGLFWGTLAFQNVGSSGRWTLGIAAGLLLLIGVALHRRQADGRRGGRVGRRRLFVLAGLLLVGLVGAGIVVWILLTPPRPSVIAVGPDSVYQGATQELRLSGQHFRDPVTVGVGGPGVRAEPAERESGRQLRVTIDVERTAAVGRRDVTVKNPDGRTGTCRACLVITPPPPEITHIEPNVVDRGLDKQTITVHGRNFLHGVVVTVSGEGIPSGVVTFNSDSEIRVEVSVAATAPLGGRDVTLTNPGEGPGVRTFTCRPACLTVRPPAPAVRSASPGSLVQGAAKREVTVTGSDFDGNPTVTVAGTGVAVESVRRASATSLAVTLSVSHTAVAGARELTVTNGDGRAGTCQPGCLTISAMAPARPCRSAPIRSEAIAGTAGLRTLTNGQLIEPNVSPLEGTFADMQPGYSVWVLVYPHLAGRYYPQTHRAEFTAAEILGNGEFRTSASFGGAEGELYDVILVFAGADATQFFSRTLEAWARANDFRGLLASELPPVLDEKQCIVVTGIRRG